MKKKRPTAFGRRMSQATADWIASSEKNFKATGRYATDQERAQARAGLNRLNARKVQ